MPVTSKESIHTYIVVDSTELFRQPHLGSVDWTVVQEFLVRHDATLVVPRIVVEEAIRHYETKCCKAIQEVNRAYGALRKQMNIETPKNLLEDIEVAPDIYRAQLMRRLDTLQARVPSYNDLSIEKIVRRSIENRKPFQKSSDKGFRDTLVWESVFELLQETNGRVLLITGNSSDFGSATAIAPDLTKELEESGIPLARLSILEDIQSFCRQHAKPKLEQLTLIKQQLQTNTCIWFEIPDFLDQIKDEIEASISNSVSVSHTLDSDRAGVLGESSLSSVDNAPTNIEVYNVYRLGSDEVTFTISCILEGVVDSVEYEYEGPYEPRSKHSFQEFAIFTVYVDVVVTEVTGKMVGWNVNDADVEFGDVIV